MIDLQTLEQFPYFAGMEKENLSELAAITERKTFPAGARIFEEGENAQFLYVIVRGQVEITYLLAKGKHIGIQTLTRGDLLVWSAIIEPYKTTSEGTAKEETQVLAIDAKRLREFFETDPYLAHALTQTVAKMLDRRLRIARQKFAILVEALEDVLQHSKE
jgi:CRP-like cAMP-binding protein